ncbi:hypothetical protein [Parafrankia discariae]|uniref:hypothetical protein n=1 Tax=Parafrankia discariae TaxID=365528 RepID=UPI000374B7FA|nr:hypothetical protein [Parafrankia discariae]
MTIPRDHADTAIRQHLTAITHRLRTRWRISPSDTRYDDLYSDAQLALWRALASDPHATSRADDPAALRRWVNRRIDWVVVDYLRHTTIAAIPGRRLAQPHVDITDDITSAADAAAPAAPDIADDVAQADAVRTLLARLRAIDPRLPGVVVGLAAGHTQADAALRIGVGRTRVGQLLADARIILARAEQDHD